MVDAATAQERARKNQFARRRPSTPVASQESTPSLPSSDLNEQQQQEARRANERQRMFREHGNDQPNNSPQSNAANKSRLPSFDSTSELQQERRENEQRRQSMPQQGLSSAQGVGRAAGTAGQAAGAGMQAAGAVTQLAGRGLGAAGSTMARAGAGLSKTGVGAIAGVPLAALGGTTSLVGKAAQGGGQMLQSGGKAVRSAGKQLKQASGGGRPFLPSPLQSAEHQMGAARQLADSQRVANRLQTLANVARRFGGGLGEQVFGSAGEILQNLLGKRGKQVIYGLLLIPPIFTPLISPQTFLFRPLLLFAADAYWWSTSHSSILKPLAMWEKAVIALAHFFYLIDILVFGIILYTLTHPCYLLDFVDLGVFNFLRNLMERTCSPELIEKFLKVAT